MELSERQALRYSRQILLPEIGREGQQRLLGAKVALVGAGGLGSAVGFYLVAAGVGTLGVIDGDRVELSNLQRQIAHTTRRLGALKAESARAAWEALNDDVRVVPHPLRLTAANIRGILEDYRVVADCSDNFATRYLVNDACVLMRKTLVSAAIFRFEGRVMTVRPGAGPCFRCLFEVPPSPDLVPSGAELGVLGVVPGVIGTLQATEVLKAVLGIGAPLSGRLLSWNALETSFVEVNVPRNPRCPVCGERPTITDLGDGDRPGPGG